MTMDETYESFKAEFVKEHLHMMEQYAEAALEQVVSAKPEYTSLKASLLYWLIKETKRNLEDGLGILEKMINSYSDEFKDCESEEEATAKLKLSNVGEWSKN